MRERERAEGSKCTASQDGLLKSTPLDTGHFRIEDAQGVSSVRHEPRDPTIFLSLSLYLSLQIHYNSLQFFKKLTQTNSFGYQ